MNYTERVINELSKDTETTFYVDYEDEVRTMSEIVSDDTITVNVAYEVTGETYSRRVAIKAAGGKWNSTREKWQFKERPEKFETEAVYSAEFEADGAKASICAIRECEKVIAEAIAFANTKDENALVKREHVKWSFYKALEDKNISKITSEGAHGYNRVAKRAAEILSEELKKDSEKLFGA